MCGGTQNQGQGGPVPDFETVGFSAGAGGGAPANAIAQAHAKLGDVKALALSVCVGASYNTTTNQICFTIPVYGDLCVTSPVSIPVGGALKACAQTCGSFIPTGLQVAIYLNNNPSPIFTGTIVGFC